MSHSTQESTPSSVSINKACSDVLHCSAASSHMRCACVFGRLGASAGQGPCCRRHRGWAPCYPYQRLPVALPLLVRECPNFLPVRDRAGLLPARLRAQLRSHNSFSQALLRVGEQLDPGDFSICRQQCGFSFSCWVQRHHERRRRHLHQVLGGPYCHWCQFLCR
jgi:hypothetical protein